MPVSVELQHDHVLVESKNVLAIEDTYIQALYDIYCASSPHVQTRVMQAFSAKPVEVVPMYLSFSALVRSAVSNMAVGRGMFKRRYYCRADKAMTLPDFVLREKARTCDVCACLGDEEIGLAIEALEEAGLTSTFDEEEGDLCFDCSKTAVYAARGRPPPPKDHCGAVALKFVLIHPLTALPEVINGLTDFVDADLQDTLARKIALHDGLRQKSDELDFEVSSLLKRMQACRTKKGNIATALAVINARVEGELEAAKSDVAGRKVDLSKQLDANARALEKKRAEIKSVQRDTAEASNRLKKADMGLQAVRAELAAAEAELLTVAAELRVARDELRVARDELAAACVSKTSALAEIGAAVEEVERCKGGLAMHEFEVITTRINTDACVHELDYSKLKLAELRSEIKAASEQMHAAHVELCLTQAEFRMIRFRESQLRHPSR